MKPKLKPCPFCQSEVEFDDDKCVIICQNCHFYYNIEEDTKKAFKKWNRRDKPKKIRDVKAFAVYVDGFPETFISAETASKARYKAYASLKESGYSEHAQFKSIRVVRAEASDRWAKTAKKEHYAYDHIFADLLPKRGL